MVPIDESRFEMLVGEALDRIPDPLWQMIDNVVVVVEEEHPTEDLFGLYDGVPLIERGEGGGLQLPDRITIYRRPILEACLDEAEVVEEVIITVLHEVAHHFGLDDEDLDRLGWA